MKTIILAGGLGTRLSEETSVRPKPMVEVGGQPILLHIMQIYSSQGFNDFVVCLGYKGYYIKEFFNNYLLHMSDVTFDFGSSAGLIVHQSRLPSWRVTLVDTGDLTQTGGRLARVRQFTDDSTFMLTYGDGVADVDINALVAFHRRQKKKATITAVQPAGRFGALAFADDGEQVTRFEEKPAGDGGWINGGFFVMEPGVFDYLGGDDTVLEREPLQNLARDGQLSAFRHTGFWHAMDTLRDKSHLDRLCASGTPPWSRPAAQQSTGRT
jgi:glucose-1-phosphate cytidylyltransferase